MTIDIRRPMAHELRFAIEAAGIAALHGPLDDEGWEKERANWEEASSLSAWDGECCVGHAAQFIVDTTVPGGDRLATGAVTSVGVLPTHRRMRVATRLIEGLVVDAVERDLVLMSLRASESVLYGRYGFGMAGEYVKVTIDAVRARHGTPVSHDGSFRLVHRDQLLTVLPDLYERVAHRRPGIVTRPMGWWRSYLNAALAANMSSHVVVHVGRDGTLDGFAHYDVKWNADDSAGEGVVYDVFGIDDAVELSLWSFLLNIDLVATWIAEERPLDDPVRWAIADRRAYKVMSVTDEQWVRLVDVGRALSTRTYNAAAGSITIEVGDPLIERNNGRWTVSAAGVGATTGPADLTLDVSALSAAYLGGTGWHTLLAVGQVDQHSPHAIAVADTLFASRPLPFCGSYF